jgi:hypothetical protein
LGVFFVFYSGFNYQIIDAGYSLATTPVGYDNSPALLTGVKVLKNASRAVF